MFQQNETALSDIGIRDINFDVIIIAGQSNAEGNGLRNSGEEVISGNVYHLIDKNPASVHDENGKAVLDITIPTEMQIEIAHERKSSNGKTFYADFSETFACGYGKEFLDAKRKVLIVKTAIGGTGFTKKQWGTGNVLLKRLYDMVDYALSLNKNNRIVAFLWHQGEHDAFESPQFTPKERYDFYFEKFIAQTEEIRKRYERFDFPVITGEFVNDWANKNKEQCDSIESATKDACAKLGKAGQVSSKGLLSNDQSIHNGDDIHFCAESVYELGRRYYNEFKRIQNERKAMDLG